MVRSPVLLLSACLIAIQLAGCATMDSRSSVTRKSTDSAKSKSKTQASVDGDTDADEENDASWGYDGEHSRAAIPHDEALDPWYGKFDYADKGRAIERSLQ